jgi:hypothetical protein
VTKWAMERWYHLGKSGYQKARALRR